MQHILFIGIDFDQYLRLKDSLSEYACVYSVSLPDGIKQFNHHQFCIIILNLSLGLPDAGQEELLRSFRRAHPVPIIALCDNTEDSNVIRLLDAGADQVLTLQIPDEVLTAYMHTLINRYTMLDYIDRGRPNQTDFRIGDFFIDLRRRQVCIKGEKIDLTSKEFDLLLFFAQNPDQILTEEQIYEKVWHIDKDFHSSISKPINRLRQKIEPDHSNPIYIRSIRGIGYQFVSQPVESCDI